MGASNSDLSNYSELIAAVAHQLNMEGHRNRAGRERSAQMVHHVMSAR